MSKQSRQRLREAAKQKEKRFAGKNKFLLLAAVAFVAAGAFAWIHFHQDLQRPNAIVAIEAPTFKQPETLKELLALSPAELERCDIARMNLLCAEGLPGAENLNVDESLATLDQWAQHIKTEIDRNHHHFQEDPNYYYNSESFYKMLMMAVVLYEDYNIRYDPKWIAPPSEIQGDDHFFADSRDILIHGLAMPPAHWISRDLSKSDPNSANLYIFVRNNAISRIDVNGLDSMDSCKNAPPQTSTSTGCAIYGNETYAPYGLPPVSLKCFCQNAPDDEWSQQVRGCLMCMHSKGVPTAQAHSQCYAWASEKYSEPYTQLAETYAKCKICQHYQ